VNLLEIVLVVLLLLFRFGAVLAEVSFEGIRRSKVEKDAAQGDKKSCELLARLDDAYRLIPVIQLAGVILLLSIGLICARALFADSNSSAVIVAERGFLGTLLLIVTLFVGDLIPRSIALKYPEAVGRHFGCPSIFFAKLVKPIFYPVFALTELILLPLGVSAFESNEVSEEDIKAMVAEGKRSGAVEEGERQIIHRVFRLGDKQAATVMTPRNQVASLHAHAPFHESVTLAIASRRTWLPVLEDGTDEVLGIISARDLLDLQRSSPSGSTREVIHDRLTNPVRSPDTAPLLSVIDSMRKERIHFAVIVDEYGAFAGVVTLHDVVEALIGEVGELEDLNPNILKRPDGSFLVDAGVAIDDLWEELVISEESPYSDSEFHSLGGFIMSRLGRVPKEGDRFEAHGYTFEVVDMDRHRIDKVLISPLTKSSL
jgi:putative hemolysin